MRVVFGLIVMMLLANSPAARAQQTDGNAGQEQELSGRVLDALDGRAIPGATAKVESRSARVDGLGRFRIALPEGTYTLEASAEGYMPRSVDVVVKTGDNPELEIALVPKGHFSEEVEVVGRVSKVKAPAVLPVRPSQVLEVAGGADNVFRVLHTLPGVSGTDEFTGRLSVRGGGPDQNLTVMDGVEVHNPYRLFGLASAFNPETVQSFELTAGAFSARYGDRLSSLLVVENRAGTRDKPLTGSGAVSLTDMNVILEGRLPKGSGSYLFSARRTWYDLIGKLFTDNDLPQFGDLQGKVTWDLGKGRSVSVFGMRSREKTDSSFDFEEEGATGTIFTRSTNDLVSATLHIPSGNHFLSRTIASVYRNGDDFDFGGDFRNEQRRSNAPDDSGFSTSRVEIIWDSAVEDWSLRQEVSFQPSQNHLVETGFEIHRLDTRLEFAIPGERNPNEANGSSLGGGSSLPDELISTRSDTRLGAWLQDRFQIGEDLVLEPGLRLDHTTINGVTSFSPRFSATYAATPSTRVKLGLGLFTQSPGYEKLFQSDYFMDLTGEGKLALENERSRHLLLSLERDLTRGTVARIEGYYKHFDRLIIGRLETEEERLARIAQYDFPPELEYSIPTSPMITTFPTNDGRGAGYGFDVYLARRATSPKTRLTGWASYTFGIARRDAYGKRYPFDYDRRHALSIVGQYRVTDRFDISATARVASGFPRTPVSGLVAAATPSAEDPERFVPELDPSGLLVYTTGYGSVADINSAELPMFARVDLRASYTPSWWGNRLKFYLDIINVSNRRNAGLIEPSLEHDPTSDLPRLIETREAWLPIIPSLGIHVSFSTGSPR